VKVREALVADPRVVAPSASAREVAELLLRPHVESALVADEGRLVGCVTRESIVAAVARGDDLTSRTAADLADGDVTTIGPESPLDEALHLMVERGLDRVVVVEDGRLLGILPREPILRRLAEDEPPLDETPPDGS
jgi:predicted transcriptional regulator